MAQRSQSARKAVLCQAGRWVVGGRSGGGAEAGIQVGKWQTCRNPTKRGFDRAVARIMSKKSAAVPTQPAGYNVLLKT
jgi:hypothetical protein